MSARKGNSKRLRIILLALAPLALGALYAEARDEAKGGKLRHQIDAAFAGWRGRPEAPFSNGEATFHKILSTLREKYVDEGISDDDFYRAAATGLLEHADAKRSAWNKLLTPTEYAELLNDLHGEIVGVGLDFRFEEESGMGVVNEAIPGTPAAVAGLKAGDRILKVDGKSFAGLQMRDIVYAIRGRVGTHVKLTMLRDASVFEQDLVRAKIGFEEAEVSQLPDGLALVRVRSFTSHTAEKVASGLKA